MPKNTPEPLQHDRITIKDQEHRLPSALTVREFRLIKLQYGILGGNLDYAVAAGDQDGFAAYALIALRRAKPDTPLEEHIAFLEDLPAGDIRIDYAPETEGSQSPPA